MYSVVPNVHNNAGDGTLKRKQEPLESLLKTTQMSQTGIRSILDTSMEAALRKALKKQLKEFDNIESEVYALAAQRGWELKELDPAVRFLTDRFNRMKMAGNSTDSKIASLMIQENTRGIIESTKNLHKLSDEDIPLQILSQKLLDCENAGIRQMLRFL